MLPNTVIYANLLPFIAIFFVMFFVRINPLFNKKQNKLFFFSSAIILFMLIVISTDYTLSLLSLEFGWIVRRITSFLHFSFSCLTPILLILIFTNKKMNPLLYIPAGINAILCLFSIFFDLVFFISTEGGYSRGPLFFFPTVVTLFYLVYLLASSIKFRHSRSYEALFIFGVILGLSLALYLEIVERFKFLTWDFTAVFLILYYLLLNINKSKLDSLTLANNRAMYLQKIDRINRVRNCFIAMLDINDFKNINDQKGHEVGDKYLVKLVEIAKNFTDKKNILYRIGGDEFAFISEDVSMTGFKERVGNFIEKLKEHNIFCAVGFEEYLGNDDIENAIHVADMKMYEDKRRFYTNKE